MGDQTKLKRHLGNDLCLDRLRHLLDDLGHRFHADGVELGWTVPTLVNQNKSVGIRHQRGLLDIHKIILNRSASELSQKLKGRLDWVINFIHPTRVTKRCFTDEAGVPPSSNITVLIVA